MKRVGHRIALFFDTSQQWLSAAPRYRGALLCGLAAIGAMIVIGYNGKKAISPSAPATPPHDPMPAPDLASSIEPGTSDARTSRAENTLGFADPVGFSPANGHSRSGRQGLPPGAIALDKSFLAAQTENEWAVVEEKDDGTSAEKKSAKKPRRRVSNDRDRKFSPSREIKRARDEILQTIRRIF